MVVCNAWGVVVVVVAVLLLLRRVPRRLAADDAALYEEAQELPGCFSRFILLADPVHVILWHHNHALGHPIRAERRLCLVTRGDTF